MKRQQGWKCSPLVAASPPIPECPRQGCAVLGAGIEAPQVKGDEEEDAAVTQTRRALGTRWVRGEHGGPAALPWGHLLPPAWPRGPRAVAAGAAGAAGPGVRALSPAAP